MIMVTSMSRLDGRRKAMEESSEIFLKNVANHEMTVCHDDGVHRHIRFRRAKASEYWFDIITWEGCLAIQGDMGCFVFSRISDMFAFFRNGIHREESAYHSAGSLSINVGYWSEKLIAPKEHSSKDVRDFCRDSFRDCVKEWLDYEVEQLVDDDENEVGEPVTSPQRQSMIDALLEAVKWDILSGVDDGEHESRNALQEFSFRFDDGTVLNIHDSWEWEFYAYQCHYLWCLWAIVWGIRMYDDQK